MVNRDMKRCFPSLIIRECKSKPHKKVPLYSCQKGCDEMVASFQYAALEALTRIEQKKKPARLIFVLKEHPSLKEYLLSSSVKNVTAAPANPFVASGEAAFANFAENIAAYASEKENISVLLITGDLQNEFMQKQSTFASWLKDYINASF